MLDKYGKLQVAVLVYFVIGFPIALWVCIRQGFGRHAGWLYLFTLTIVRITGAILRIVAENKPSLGVEIAAGVFAAIGLIPLLLCLMGMVKRVNDGTSGPRHPPRWFQLIHIVTIAGLALTIAAASETGSTNPDTLKQMQDLRKAASILFLVVVLATTALMILFAGQIRFIHPGDKIIVTCALLAAPFLIVRVLYAVLVAFLNNATFNSTAPNIYVEAFMQSLMEFIAFAILVSAGIIAPPIKSDEYIGGGSELIGSKNPSYGAGPGREQGYNNNRPGQYREQQYGA